MQIIGQTAEQNYFWRSLKLGIFGPILRRFSNLSLRNFKTVYKHEESENGGDSNSRFKM